MCRILLTTLYKGQMWWYYWAQRESVHSVPAHGTILLRLSTTCRSNWFPIGSHFVQIHQWLCQCSWSYDSGGGGGTTVSFTHNWWHAMPLYGDVCRSSHAHYFQLFWFTNWKTANFPRALTPGENGRGVKLTTDLQSSNKVKNAWSYTSTPQYVFMAWCLVKAQGQLYPCLC
jgi:hypothetical protein